MSKYSIRIVLHGAPREAYDKLHAAMKAKRFATTIVATDGNTYHLPPAEYQYEGQETAEAIHAIVRAEASSAWPQLFGPGPSVVVEEIGRIVFSGLNLDNAYLGEALGLMRGKSLADAYRGYTYNPKN